MPLTACFLKMIVGYLTAIPVTINGTIDVLKNFLEIVTTIHEIFKVIKEICDVIREIRDTFRQWNAVSVLLLPSRRGKIILISDPDPVASNLHFRILSVSISPPDYEGLSPSCHGL